jgi:hypothetical protein
MQPPALTSTEPEWDRWASDHEAAPTNAAATAGIIHSFYQDPQTQIRYFVFTVRRSDGVSRAWHVPAQDDPSRHLDTLREIRAFFSDPVSDPATALVLASPSTPAAI